MCGGDGGASAAAQRQADEAQKAADDQKAQEAARQGRVTAGMDSINGKFAGYDDNFYNGIRKSYMDWATPQLDDQYQTQRRDLVYALARNGLVDSSEGARAAGQLEKDLTTNRQSIVDNADGYANQTRSNVNSNRTALVNSLQASADPDAVNADMQGRAASIEAPQTFSPLGQMFASLASAYNTYNSSANAAQLAATFQQAGIPVGGGGLFRPGGATTPSAGSLRVVN